MKRLSLLVALVSLLVLTAALVAGAQRARSGAAAEEKNVSVEQMDICTDVVDRMPEGTATSFSSAVEKLYCWTAVKSTSAGPDSVLHVWYYGEKEMASVPLKIAPPRWRTWSSKRILPGWTGSWRVDVVEPDGTVIESTSFAVGQ